MNACIRNESDEVMDVLTEVRQLRRHEGVLLTFIDSAGQQVVMQLAGNVARDLRDELNELGERLY